MQRAYPTICNVGAAALTGCPKPTYREASRPTVAASVFTASHPKGNHSHYPEAIKHQAIAMYAEGNGILRNIWGSRRQA